MTALLIDTSHHNALPNFAAFRSGGGAGVIAKVSEGTSFADPQFAATRAGAHAAGLALGGYHFTHLGNPKAEAAWFRQCFGPIQPGEFIGLDLEVPGSPVAWVGAFLDAMAALGEPVRLLYMNKSELSAYDWSPIVARGVLLWLAVYDHSATATPAAGPWPAVTLKQYTDAGTVPGETGTVDVDVLFGTLDQLTGPGGPFMAALTDAQQAQLYDWVNQLVTVIGHAFDGDGDDLGTKVKALATNLAPVQRYAADGTTIVTVPVNQEIADAKTASLKLEDQVAALAAQVAALQQAVATAPGMTCQGSPKAVLSAIGQAASTAASGA